MRLIANQHLLLVLYLAGCVSSRPPQPTVPIPSPSVPEAVNAAPNPWSFSFTPGTAAYRISRAAAIEDSDSATRREISTNSSYESITLHLIADTIGFTAVVDTFSTRTQGVIAPAQVTQLPLQLSGFRIGDSLVIASDSSAEKCNPVTTELITDLHNLLPQFPAILSTNLIWKDSTHLHGCQGSITTESYVSRSYRVIGESTYESVPVVVIQRTDTIQAAGEGAQQQHRLLLDARGAGNATYYLDASSGRVLHLSVTQDLNLTITASGKTNHFRQNTKQEFALVR